MYSICRINKCWTEIKGDLLLGSLMIGGMLQIFVQEKKKKRIIIKILAPWLENSDICFVFLTFPGAGLCYKTNKKGGLKFLGPIFLFLHPKTFTSSFAGLNLYPKNWFKCSHSTPVEKRRRKCVTCTFKSGVNSPAWHSLSRQVDTHSWCTVSLQELF